MRVAMVQLRWHFRRSLFLVAFFEFEFPVCVMCCVFGQAAVTRPRHCSCDSAGRQRCSANIDRHLGNIARLAMTITDRVPG
ncbi:hypothetical protein DFH27DRAFT_574879 [Peziza echinospora]|nr:hypothetical protein DFH27DRAFT_574879 [Peziza echinospora]